MEKEAKEFYDNFEGYESNDITEGDIVISKKDLFKLMSEFAQQQNKENLERIKELEKKNSSLQRFRIEDAASAMKREEELREKKNQAIDIKEVFFKDLQNALERIKQLEEGMKIVLDDNHGFGFTDPETLNKIESLLQTEEKE